jgi:hypothetical protein
MIKFQSTTPNATVAPHDPNPAPPTPAAEDEEEETWTSALTNPLPHFASMSFAAGL